MYCPICNNLGVSLYKNDLQFNQYYVKELIYVPFDFCYCKFCHHCYRGNKFTYNISDIYINQPQTNISVNYKMNVRVKNIIKDIGLDNIVDKRILEVGGGSGELTYHISTYAKTVDYLEPGKIVNNLIFPSNVNIINNFFDSNLDLSKYDLIIFKQVLEHFDNYSLLNNLENFNGLIYIEVPSLDWILSNCSIADIHHQHINYFSPNSLKLLLKKYNFHIRNFGTLLDGHDFYCVFDKSSNNIFDFVNFNNDVKLLEFKFNEQIKQFTLFSFQNKFILYGATAQALSWVNFSNNNLLYLIDDNLNLNNNFMYNKINKFEIINFHNLQLNNNIPVLISAYLHETNILKKLIALNNVINIFSLYPSNFLKRIN